MTIFHGLRTALAAMALAAPLAPAQAQFGPTIVRGATIEMPPRTLMSDASLFASQRLCAQADGQRERILDELNAGIGRLNAELRKHNPGWSLVRHRFDLAPCQARAELTTQGIVMRVVFPGTRLTGNITQGTILGQWADPRLSVTFDLAVAMATPLPTAGAGCAGHPGTTVMVRNVSRPQGENLSGDIVVKLASLLAPDSLNGLLASGFSADDLPVDPKILELDRLLCRGGISYRSSRVGMVPGEQLLISLSSSARFVDTRCIDGYAWREARPGDNVCVTTARRTAVRQENAQHRNRVVPRDPRQVMLQGACLPGTPCTPRALPPQPCLSGFVWREAVQDDFICVTPQSRALAAQENRTAARYRRDYEPVIH